MRAKDSILIVKDDQNAPSVLCDALRERGLRSCSISSGFGSIEGAKVSRFDLVILDIELPKTDVVQLFKEIRKFDPNVKVIIMTPYPDSRIILESLERGSCAVVRKPLDPEKLAWLICEVLTPFECNIKEGSDSRI